MISFTDFLPVPEPQLTKVKFNMRSGDGSGEALDFLMDDHDHWLRLNQWRTKQTNNNMGGARFLLAFAQYYPYGPQYFMFGGAFEVREIKPDRFDDLGYELIPSALHEDYVKRLIVKLDTNIGRAPYLRHYVGLQESRLAPEVYELAPDVKLGTFPGYQNVRLRHHELQRIIAGDEPSWRDALSSVKGVYKRRTPAIPLLPRELRGFYMGWDLNPLHRHAACGTFSRRTNHDHRDGASATECPESRIYSANSPTARDTR